MKNFIKSPITDSVNVEIIETINSEEIITSYRSKYNIDLSSYFEDTKQISVCLCKDTGYQFFYPFIVGDSKFYEHFQNFGWYYIKDKWEYQKAYSIAENKSSVLEIGPGHGYFMKKLRQKSCNLEGIELNESAAAMLREEGFKVYAQTLESFNKDNPEAKYDLVCSFQVMEHITNVGDFLNIFEKLLKPGGKLVIGVPNADSIFSNYKVNILNLPPHHAGLWTYDFMSSNAFKGLNLDNIFWEPNTFFDQINAGIFLTKLKYKKSQILFYLVLPINLIKGLFLNKRSKSKHLLAVYSKRK
jgi:SAM-dependent methyltransferase